MDNTYPDMIKNLPKADIPFKGIKGWILQNTNHQMVFFDIEPIGEVPEHVHGSQWGIVIKGKMDLTVDGITKTYAKGDHYFIPENVKHSALFQERTQVIDFFADTNRYKILE